MGADAVTALLESPLAAATRRLVEATREEIAAWRQLGAVLQQAYLQACAADPGLHRAWEKRLRQDPDVGWLDVAVERERAHA